MPYQEIEDRNGSDLLFWPRSTHKRKRQPAEAPVTTEEVRQMQDTLDFLAKYCIVSKDRLPFYERIYSNNIDCQPMKYDREPILSPRTGMPISKDEQEGHEMVWEKHQEQLNKLHDMVTTSQGHDDFRPQSEERRIHNKKQRT